MALQSKKHWGCSAGMFVNCSPSLTHLHLCHGVQPLGLVPVLVCTGQTQDLPCPQPSFRLQPLKIPPLPTSQYSAWLIPVLSPCWWHCCCWGLDGSNLCHQALCQALPGGRKQWRHEGKGQTSMWARTVADTLIMNVSCIPCSSMSKSYFRLWQLERMI